MSELDIIRAWKDKAYRNSLNADELAQLPEHPAGEIELTDVELASIDGGTQATPTTTVLTTAIVCHFTLETALCVNTLLAAGACPTPTLGIGTAPCYTAGGAVCPIIN